MMLLLCLNIQTGRERLLPNIWRTLCNHLSAESNARDVGKVFEVLVEGFSKRSRSQLFGRTEQNKVVVFDKGNRHIGDFVKVRITESSSATLKGEEAMNSE